MNNISHLSQRIVQIILDRKPTKIINSKTMTTINISKGDWKTHDTDS